MAIWVLKRPIKRTLATLLRCARTYWVIFTSSVKVILVSAQFRVFRLQFRLIYTSSVGIACKAAPIPRRIL